MVCYYEFKCDKCNFEIKTSGPHEFIFVDRKIKALRHPSGFPADGVFLNIYCPKCKKNHNLILVEFEKRGGPWETKKENIKNEYLKNYADFIQEHPGEKVHTECFNYDAVKCPVCSFKEVIMHPEENINCPNCNEGKIKLHHEIIT